MIRTMLTDAGHVVYECSDGSEAVRAYETIRPNALLMDIQMEPMDGIKATELIKKQHPHAKIVILTQYDTQIYRDAALRAEADAFLSKDDLTQALRLIEELNRL